MLIDSILKWRSDIIEKHERIWECQQTNINILVKCVCAIISNDTEIFYHPLLVAFPGFEEKTSTYRDSLLWYTVIILGKPRSWWSCWTRLILTVQLIPFICMFRYEVLYPDNPAHLYQNVFLEKERVISFIHSFTDKHTHMQTYLSIKMSP